MPSGKKCLICESENTSFHFKCKDYLVSGEGFDIFICNNCGFLFTMNQPDRTEIEKYYDTESYISHSDTKKGLLNFLYHLSRRLMIKHKKNIIRRITGLKSGTLLDIGSGTGYFMSEMKKSGWVAKGIENNEKARDFSVLQFGLEVIQPEEIFTLSSGSFDCITMWHVLEHLQEPFKYTSEILRLLKPGGTCIIALPNCNSFDAEYYREFWAAYDVPRHLWHFAPRTLRLFAGRTGFNIKAIKSLPFDVFYISALSEKYRGNKLSFLAGMIKGLWFTVLSAFNPEKSSSLIYFLQTE